MSHLIISLVQIFRTVTLLDGNVIGKNTKFTMPVLMEMIGEANSRYYFCWVSQIGWREGCAVCLRWRYLIR
jgi:hypothetical protein